MLFARRNSQKIVIAMISGVTFLNLLHKKYFFSARFTRFSHGNLTRLRQARLIKFLNFILDIIDHEVETTLRKTHRVNNAIHQVCVSQGPNSLFLRDAYNCNTLCSTIV